MGASSVLSTRLVGARCGAKLANYLPIPINCQGLFLLTPARHQSVAVWVLQRVFSSANGATQLEPTATPWDCIAKRMKALKGRANPCRNRGLGLERPFRGFLEWSRLAQGVAP